MWAVFAVETAIAIGAVVFLLRKYASWRQCPWYAYVFTALGWGIAVAPVFLAPADLAQAISYDADVDRLVLYYVWKSVYWVAFFLTWLICPLLQDFADSGGFTFFQRLRTALIINGIFYGSALLVVIGFVIYLAVAKQFGKEEFLTLAASLGNAVGLCLLLLLLGFGLVDVPRELWRKANYTMMMRRLQFDATLLAERTDEARNEQRAALEELRQARAEVPFHSPLRKWVDIIISKVSPAELDPPGSHHAGAPSTKSGKGRHRDDEGEYGGDFDEKRLIALHSRVMVAEAAVRREKLYWDELCHTYFKLEDSVAAARDPSHSFRTVLRRPRQGRFGPLLDRLEWWWRVWLRPGTLRTGAVLLGALSLTIVWSEMMVVVLAPDMSVFSQLVHNSGLPPFVLQILISLPTLYMVYCAAHALFGVRVWKVFNLFKHGQSPPSSLLFSAAYLSRIAAPVAFNILNLSRLTMTRNTAFQDVLGDFDVVPALGTYFPYYAPAGLIALCLLTLLNVGSRLMNLLANCLGRFGPFAKLRTFVFDEAYNDARIDRGRALLQDARKRKERELGSDSDMLALIKDHSTDASAGDEDDELPRSRDISLRLMRPGRTGSVTPMDFETDKLAASAPVPVVPGPPSPPPPPSRAAPTPSPVRAPARLTPGAAAAGTGITPSRSTPSLVRLEGSDAGGGSGGGSGSDRDRDRPGWSASESVNSATGAALARMFAARRIGDIPSASRGGTTPGRR